MKWLVTSFIIFILGVFNFLSPVRGVVQFMFNPLQFGLQEVAFGLKDSAQFFSNLRNIKDENLFLLEEVDNLRSEVLSLKQLEEENKLLREQLSLPQDFEGNEGLILAEALGNFQDNTATSIVLNRGSDHGVAEGDLVVKGRHLIGIVRAKTPKRSEVTLITAPDLSLSVIDFETGTEGVASGDFGTSVVMTKILPGEQVNQGDTVVTSGRDGKAFPGYIVGEVSSVSEESAEVLKTASLSVVVNLNSLDRVFVLPIRQ